MENHRRRPRLARRAPVTMTRTERIFSRVVVVVIALALAAIAYLAFEAGCSILSTSSARQPEKKENSLRAAPRSALGVVYPFASDVESIRTPNLPAGALGRAVPFPSRGFAHLTAQGFSHRASDTARGNAAQAAGRQTICPSNRNSLHTTKCPGAGDGVRTLSLAAGPDQTEEAGANISSAISAASVLKIRCAAGASEIALARLVGPETRTGAPACVLPPLQALQGGICA